MADFGSNNSARAIGDGSYARACDGNNNTAAVFGMDSFAIAIDGDNNQASAAGSTGLPSRSVFWA